MGEQRDKKWEDAAKDLRIQPSDQVWNRLENRLNQDHGKVHVRVVRKWLGVAATLLLLIAGGFYLLIPKTNVPDMLVFQELEEPSVKATFAAYKYVSDINGYYQSDGWKQISEGMHKPIVASSQVKEINEVPAILIQEDSTM